MSDGTMRKLLQKTLGVDATVHGFRSTFKTWASETTNHPNEVSEMALAHTIGSKTEAAYRRGDLLQKRKELMQDWSDFLCSKNGKVISLGKGNLPVNEDGNVNLPEELVASGFQVEENMQDAAIEYVYGDINGQVDDN